MSTTYRIEPPKPKNWRPKHRRPVDQETTGLIACLMVWGGGIVAAAAVLGLGMSGVIR